MKITDRYASAVRSSNLKSVETTVKSDADVLGAFGLAGKAKLANGRPGAPLAVALTRLFTGDNHSVREIVDSLSRMVWQRAKDQDVKLRRIDAVRMAQCVLAWHRNGVCRHCNGLGFQLIVGAPSLSENKCTKCRGLCKRPFDDEFPLMTLDLARWLLSQLEREMGKAGPAAMAALAPRVDLP